MTKASSCIVVKFFWFFFSSFSHANRGGKSLMCNGCCYCCWWCCCCCCCCEKQKLIKLRSVTVILLFSLLPAFDSQIENLLRFPLEAMRNCFCGVIYETEMESVFPWYTLKHKYCHLLISRCNFKNLCLARECQQTLFCKKKQVQLFQNHQLCKKNQNVAILVLHSVLGNSDPFYWSFWLGQQIALGTTL